MSGTANSSGHSESSLSSSSPSSSSVQTSTSIHATSTSTTTSGTLATLAPATSSTATHSATSSTPSMTTEYTTQSPTGTLLILTMPRVVHRVKLDKRASRKRMTQLSPEEAKTMEVAQTWIQEQKMERPQIFSKIQLDEMRLVAYDIQASGNFARLSEDQLKRIQAAFLSLELPGSKIRAVHVGDDTELADLGVFF